MAFSSLSQPRRARDRRKARSGRTVGSMRKAVTLRNDRLFFLSAIDEKRGRDRARESGLDGRSGYAQTSPEK